MRSGENRALDGRTPFVLDDPEVGWLVRDGRVDVFAVEVADGRPAGRRHPVCSAATGDLLVGVEPSGALALIGVGVTPTSVERVALAEVAADGDGPALVEQWAERLAIGLRPPDEAEAVTLVAGEPAELAAGDQARVARGTAWVDAAGLELLGAPGTGWVPVPPGAWVEATAPVALTPVTAPEARPWQRGPGDLRARRAGPLRGGHGGRGRGIGLGSNQLQGAGRRAEHEGLWRARRRRARGAPAQVAATGEGALLAACRIVGAAGRTATWSSRRAARCSPRAGTPLAGGDRAGVGAAHAGP